MRTEINPVFTAQTSASKASSQEIDLTNQLLKVNGNQPAFDRVLEQQRAKPAAQSSTDNTQARADDRRSEQQRQPSEAKPKQDSGKSLPSSRVDEQQQKQQTDQARADQQRDRHDRAADTRQNSEAEAGRQLNSQEQRNRVADCRAAPSNCTGEKSPDATQLISQEQLQPSLEETEQTTVSIKHTGRTENAELMIDDMTSQISVSTDLLEKAKQSLQTEDSADTETMDDGPELATLLSDEEKLALDEEVLASTNIEGQGFVGEQPDERIDIQEKSAPVTPVSGAPLQAKVAEQQAFVPEQLSTKESLAKPAITPLSAQPVQSSNIASEKSSVQETLDKGEPESWELGKEKKVEVGNLTSKLQTKTPSPELNVVTPVQERLAALARVLDRSGGNRERASTASLNAVDSAKPASVQKGVDQISQAPPQSNRMLNSAVQTPLQTGMQNAMLNREWASEVSQRLLMMVSSKIQSAQIQLNPRDMGPIDIKVTMQQDQANVVFSSQVSQTREALEQAIPRLREMFDESGVGLADVDVRDQDTQQSKQREGQQAQDGKSWDGDSSIDEEAESETSVTQSLGLVDYYA